jgi:hypothetical protein
MVKGPASFNLFAQSLIVTRDRVGETSADERFQVIDNGSVRLVDNLSLWTIGLLLLHVVMVGCIPLARYRNWTRLEHNLTNWLLYGGLLSLMTAFYQPLLIYSILNVTQASWIGDSQSGAWNNILAIVLVTVLIVAPFKIAY